MVGLRTDRLAVLPATFTTGQAELMGLWRRDLYLLRDDGVVSEISRGVYRKSEAPETAHLDFFGGSASCTVGGGVSDLRADVA